MSVLLKKKPPKYGYLTKTITISRCQAPGCYEEATEVIKGNETTNSKQFCQKHYDEYIKKHEKSNPPRRRTLHRKSRPTNLEEPSSDVEEDLDHTSGLSKKQVSYHNWMKRNREVNPQASQREEQLDMALRRNNQYGIEDVGRLSNYYSRSIEDESEEEDDDQADDDEKEDSFINNGPEDELSRSEASEDEDSEYTDEEDEDSDYSGESSDEEKAPPKKISSTKGNVQKKRNVRRQIPLEEDSDEEKTPSRSLATSASPSSILRSKLEADVDEAHKSCEKYNTKYKKEFVEYNRLARINAKDWKIPEVDWKTLVRYIEGLGVGKPIAMGALAEILTRYNGQYYTNKDLSSFSAYITKYNNAILNRGLKHEDKYIEFANILPKISGIIKHCVDNVDDLENLTINLLESVRSCKKLYETEKIYNNCVDQMLKLKHVHRTLNV